MKAKELKLAIDKYLRGLDEGRYCDEAHQHLNDFAEDLFPALAQRRARKNALAKLTGEEIKLLGIDPELPVPDEDTDELAVVRKWVMAYRATVVGNKSNCRDAAFDSLLQFISNAENDI